MLRPVPTWWRDVLALPKAIVLLCLILWLLSDRPMRRALISWAAAALLLLCSLLVLAVAGAEAFTPTLESCK